MIHPSAWKRFSRTLSQLIKCLPTKGGFTRAYLYAPPQHVVPSHAASRTSEGILWPLEGRFMHDHESEVPRILLLGTWVNSDGHRAHCVISSGCSRSRPARGSDRGCRQRAAQGHCVSVLVAMLLVSPSLLGGAAFAVSLGVALAGSDQLREVRLVLLRRRSE
jgi:hypothetical protein